MITLAAPQRIANTAAVLDGPYGLVTRRAQLGGTSRQALYRDTPRVLDAVEGTAARQQQEELRAEVQHYRRRSADLESQLGQAVVLDADRQAHFASTAQAEGVSLPVARKLLAVLLGAATPSVAQLGRRTRAAAQRATALLAVLDAASRPRVEQAAADEIFFGRQPCLMVVEQQSLCWLAGRRVERRDGQEWAREFRQLPHLRQLTRDAGNALGKGLALVNAERQQRGETLIADQEDHFHALREGGRALRRMQRRVARLLDKAEAVQQRADEQRRRFGGVRGLGGVAVKAWRRAEQAMDAWSAAEKTWHEVGEALQLFTPAGQLNSRGRAEALLAAALPRLQGPGWSKAKRLLQRPQLLTFLGRAEQELTALPVAAEVRVAAVQAEGLRRQPEALRGETRSAAVLRGVLLAASVVLGLSGAAGAEGGALVRGVLGQVWRASSLVECLNSVARMQQGRHRKMTQGLLDLKRLYWNCREFRTGRRRGKSPYSLLGLKLPTEDWWELLKLPPEQVRQQLSAPAVAA